MVDLAARCYRCGNRRHRLEQGVLADRRLDLAAEKLERPIRSRRGDYMRPSQRDVNTAVHASPSDFRPAGFRRLNRFGRMVVHNACGS